MKKIKNILIALMVLFMAGVFVSPKAFAETESAGGYSIKKYNVDIVVNENNTFDITEDITVNFSERRHGIYRNIPVKNVITRADGTKSSNRAKITDIKVSDDYSTSHSNNKLEIKIGDPDRTIIGDKTYHISYKYDIGKDPLKDIDEFYYNIIGPDWDVPIEGITFNVKMPKEFDEKKMGFAMGRAGTTSGLENVYVHVEENEIIGIVTETLYPQEALSIRIELPEGYFVGAGSEPSAMLYVLFAIPVLLCLAAYSKWYKYGKDEKTFIHPEYSAPEGRNSLDVAYFHKGNVDSMDVISLVVYLANKGYLKIEEIDESGFLSKGKKGFKFIKVKEYDGTDENERTFLSGLFASGNEVVKKDLYNKFYKTIQTIIKNKTKTENREKLFEKNGARTALVFCFSVIAYLIAVLPILFEFGEYDSIPFVVFYPQIAFIVTMAGFTGAMLTRELTNGFSRKIMCGFLFLIAIVPLTMFVGPLLLDSPIHLIGFVIDFAAYIGILIFLFLMPKRTPYGLEVYAKAEGYKQFLEAVEKDKIERMVLENPNFFYDVLPYTYVFNISDKWMKKFEAINLQAPDWYVGSTSTFNAMAFSTFMDTTMKSAFSSMSSSPSSGGGVSGGGSGGGGGGSW